MRLFASWVLLVAFAGTVVHAYLPGMQPYNYMNNSLVPLKVNKITSPKTQLPYPYYSLPVCKPDQVVDSIENLGELLLGDRIENSRYEIKTGVSIPCKLVCPSRKYTVEELSLLEKRISEDYRVDWLLDNLPAAERKQKIDMDGKSAIRYEQGFPLGFKSDEHKMYVNNHVNIKVLFHSSESFEGVRIVGFEVDAKSIEYPPSITTCTPGEPYPHQSVSEGKETTITWTYSVAWEFSNTPWASRWDIYLLMLDDQIHWFSIINSMMIVLFLTGMVAMIMMRTLNADLRRYREMEDQEEAQEETGWKMVHGDVFRPPHNTIFLTVFTGTGVQIVGMTIVTMIFAVLGFLSPANRGALMTAVVVLFVLMGLPAGYASAHLYKSLKGQQWKKNTLLTATLFPGFAFGIFFVLNIILWREQSSGHVPFHTLISLFTLWFGISVPFTFIGSYFAYKKPALEFPCRTNQIPRQVPDLVWYMHPVLSALMGGILPFGAVFIELFFIMSSIWLHQFYYIFGFLSIVLVILVATCAEISIVLCYFQLCSEDHHWWWRSFFTSGTSALYMLAYSVFYLVTKLHITKFVSIVLYFGYTMIFVAGFFCMTGAIGFLATLLFVRKIYGSIKID
eukprot:CAMPEP_0177648596 /NCGR_PEP_ID=MMETSP0447-20121125/10911_1 /TAXON_ID=0 /ORGANISM="Stygamoeba regulata, Strain BSH-02190019" /LENGTH=619 /DNA_ID=CAMNT_0019151245 /DNA_START=54 /DNA_END=1913 /DNA_ORIENTATION=+